MNEMADRHEAHKDAQYQLLQKVKTKFNYAFIEMSKWKQERWAGKVVQQVVAFSTIQELERIWMTYVQPSHIPIETQMDSASLGFQMVFH